MWAMMIILILKLKKLGMVVHCLYFWHLGDRDRKISIETRLVYKVRFRKTLTQKSKRKKGRNEGGKEEGSKEGKGRSKGGRGGGREIL